MKTTATVEATFNCSLERAFKTPILGDATKYLVGYGMIPAVVKFTEDETWGKVGGRRIPHSSKSPLSKGGPIGLDQIYKRKENEYWQWGVAEFYQPSMGFREFQGQLFFKEIEKDVIHVRWVYTLFSTSFFAYPFHWFFGKVFWRGQMKVGIKHMKTYAESDAPFLYE